MLNRSYLTAWLLLITMSALTRSSQGCTLSEGEAFCAITYSDNMSPTWTTAELERFNISLPNVTSLRIVSSLPANSFHLFLSLPGDAFAGLVNLQQLHLAKFQGIRAALPETLAAASKTLILVNLTMVYSGSLLASPDFPVLPKLREAYLHDNELTVLNIPWLARVVPKLRKLSLRKNSICHTVTPATEAALPELEYLDLHDNLREKSCVDILRNRTIQEFIPSELLTYFPKLKYLDMSATDVTGRHLDMWSANEKNSNIKKQIQTLKLAGCKVDYLGLLVKDFPNLKRLDLSRNRHLQEVGASLFQNLTLDALNLSGNMQLTFNYNPPHDKILFPNMTVRNLDLSIPSPFSTYSSSFWQYDIANETRATIVTLDLSGRLIPDDKVISLGEYPNLEVAKLSRMNLQSDQIKIFPNNDTVSKLRILDLSINGLTSFPNDIGVEFQHLWKADSKMEKLLLHENPNLECRACGNSYLMRWVAKGSECREQAIKVLCKNVSGTVDCPVCVDGGVMKRIDEFSLEDFAHCGGETCSSKIKSQTNSIIPFA